MSNLVVASIVQGSPTALLSLATLVVAVIAIRRSWLVALLLGLGALTSFVAYALSIAATPVFGLLITLSIGGLIRPGASVFVENVWTVIGSLIGSSSAVLILAAALVAVRTSVARRPAPAAAPRREQAPTPASYPPHPYQLPPEHHG